MTEVEYLYQIIQKYASRDLTLYSSPLFQLKSALAAWGGGCYLDILDSGSHAKRTAISLASDVDYLVSLTSSCNENSGGLRTIYESLYQSLNASYTSVRKQSVSVRINLNGLQVDVTPGRRQANTSNYYSLWVSKLGTWKQTNIQKHISDISTSARTNEIKLVKIWRELNGLDFPSIYLEYLLIKNVLYNKLSDISSLASNFRHILNLLHKDSGNPLVARIEDPANSNNILSDLLTVAEKNKIFYKAREASAQQYWSNIVW